MPMSIDKYCKPHTYVVIVINVSINVITYSANHNSVLTMFKLLWVRQHVVVVFRIRKTENKCGNN